MSIGGLIRAGTEIHPPRPQPTPGFRCPPKRSRRDRWRRPPVRRERNRRCPPIPGAPIIPGKHAVVARIGSVSTASGSGYNRTIAYNLAAGDDRICVALIGMGGTGTSISDVQFDGVSGTIQENIAGGGSQGRCAIAYRVFGSSGSSDSFDVDLTASGTFGQSGMTVVGYSGVDQSTPITDSDSGTHISTTSTSLTVTSAVGEMCVDAMVNAGSLTAWDEDIGQTELASPLNLDNTLDAVLHRSEEAGAASVTMGWSGVSASGCQCIIALAEVSGPAGPTISTIEGARSQSGQLIPWEDDVTITGTAFEALQGTGRVILSDNNGGIGVGNEVEQTVSTWSDTSITLQGFDVGGLMTTQSRTLFMYVENDTGDDSAAFTVEVAYRDVRVAVGMFVTPGSTGNFDINHYKLQDNKVKAILLITTGATADDTNEANWYSSFGISDGTTSRAFHVFSEDGVAQASSNVSRERWTDRVLHQETVGGVDENVATFVGSIQGGFRLNFSTATAGRRVFFMAFSGEDVQAIVGSEAVSAAAVTGLTFRPEWVWSQSFCDINGDPPAGFGTGTCGCFNDNLEQISLNWYLGQDAGADQTTKSASSDNDSYTGQIINGAMTWTMSVTSITSDGWTWTGLNTAGFDYLALNLLGVKTSLQQFTKSTGAAPATQALPDFGFVPQAYGILGCQRTTESPAVGNLAQQIGAFDGASMAALSNVDENNVDPMNNSHQVVGDRVVLQRNMTTGAVQAEARAEGIADDTTPNIVWDPNDANAYLLHVFAFEDPTNGPDAPPGFFPLN